MGFLRTSSDLVNDEKAWVSFALCAQKAANMAGFSRRTSAQFAGALGELRDNIYEHSGVSEDGIIAFRAEKGVFEFAASDRGMGVLESLRTSDDYAEVIDYGEALSLILTDGVSRYGLSSGRGRGFRPIFIGLANINGSLRFRSGDHALIINGQNPSLMSAQTSQKTMIEGFSASVICIV
ncbi:hypothetical protein [Azospirillum sp. B2RO_4]|uniref:hypothetical protein n=1 Tax=Azospirillum sp. B2RO_4 TaxID=3027796 RepID=UPI003DA91703